MARKNKGALSNKKKRHEVGIHQDGLKKQKSGK